MGEAAAALQQVHRRVPRRLIPARDHPEVPTDQLPRRLGGGPLHGADQSWQELAAAIQLRERRAELQRMPHVGAEQPVGLA